jgi:lipoate-protein ligase A
MKFLELTLDTPAENLACDEALLEMCEAGYERGVLRFWEPAESFIVLGYGNSLGESVDVERCRAQRVPVLRRSSGGGAVLQGPGCLNYALVLEADPDGPLGTIAGTNAFVMEAHRRALQPLSRGHLEVQGFTDLTRDGAKFSGNAQRRKRRCLLFHGTFLYDFDLDRVEQLLPLPRRQPAYRRNRRHREFLTNVDIAPGEIRAALARAWSAEGSLAEVPWQRIRELVAERYAPLTVERRLAG